jgi:hypothetical protein
VKPFVCVFLFAGSVWGQGAFAMPDESGTRLIATAEIADPAAVRKALCSDGRTIPVRYDHRQSEREGANGRQVPSQFDQLAGDVFRVSRGHIGVTAACFLAGPGWMSRTVVPVKAHEKNGACGAAIESRITASRKRAVMSCFSLVRLAGDRRVLLVEFKRDGDNALASIILMDRNRVLFADYPATFRGDGQDLWRVDDGGKLSAEGFHVIFVAQEGQQYSLGVSWAGTEGRSLAVFLSGSDNVFNRVIEDYWYQMPK